ncbi:Schizosaccharomyces specific protein [Schizosaccharomyces pombe]|uniref:Uncharacterized protein C1795.12c n=1 Tax=Schizosaccharomyces pombe (strain 972 / ATCC 24843) TaxID=284812 RepID=YCCC_SCHPO|nr:uncharacterized protein SPCC1795.12c [Schizosaccharomyces pombe]O59776.1 RecName: Full=Uncharacterized protein C1795.12c [Schizosaccharomyces pombe 972h-]CAA18647.1 sequence orphan [Schizosaccharomyces pombe]|eukprot:NP_588032.1 uncharacterized protein SPCC1795.12c [Schizosaccharomyces pombe]
MYRPTTTSYSPVYTGNPLYDISASQSDPRQRIRKNVRFQTEVDEFPDFDDSDSDELQFENRDPRKRIDPIKHMLLVQRLKRVSTSSRRLFIFTLSMFLIAFILLIAFVSFRD